MKQVYIIFLIMFATYGCGSQQQDIVPLLPVKTGLDVLLGSDFAELSGKSVGVITNHTGLTRDGRHIADLIHQSPEVTLAALFGPEHGIRGRVEGGVKVQSNKDSLTGVPVYSLYTESRKPNAEMLQNIDILIFDIQDVGARFYTYVYTMALAMESAAVHKKQFIVLDRPNPITGLHVEGPLLKEGFESFVGMFKIPVRHGMTIGELASMFKGEGWIPGADSLDLKIVKLSGWQRQAWLDETDVPWVAPSPNMRTLKTAIVYPGICFLEGTNISEGRGTEKPFEQLGAPWIDGHELAQHLNKKDLPGISFEAVTFKPVAPQELRWMKFRDESCAGIYLKITDRDKFKPVRTGVAVIRSIKDLYGEHLDWSRTMDRLYGSDRLRKGVDEMQDVQFFLDDMNQDMENFLKIREKYLLYQ